MRIAVVGTGAVGSYFGGRLAQAGEDVAFVARGDHLRAIQASGLRIESADDDFTVHPALATENASEIGLVDVVLVTVKAWQLAAAIETMRPLVGTDTLIVPLLNGVEAPDQLAATYGTHRAAGGLCRLFGSIVAPGHVRNTMTQPFITFRELDDAGTERSEHLSTAFTQAGVRSEVSPAICAALWEKLLFVGPFGGVGAVARAPIGVLRALPETRALLQGAMAEITGLAQALGVEVAPDAAEKALALLDGSPDQATASMQRDIIAGRPSELDAQIGVVVRKAQEHHREAPVHTTLYASLLPQEQRARGLLAFPS